MNQLYPDINATVQNSFANSYNALSNIYKQREQKDNQNKLQQALPGALRGDESSINALIQANPELGARVFQQNQLRQETQAAQVKEQMSRDFLGAYGGIAGLPEEQRAQSYAQTVQQLKQKYPELAQIRDDYDPVSFQQLGYKLGAGGKDDRAYLTQMGAIPQAPAKPQGMMNVSPGGAVFDPATQKEIYKAPFKPPQYAPSYTIRTRVLEDGTSQDFRVNARSGAQEPASAPYRGKPNRAPISPSAIKGMNESREAMRAAEAMTNRLAEAKSIVSGKGYGEEGADVSELAADPLARGVSWMQNKAGSTSQNSKRLIALRQVREKLRSDYLMLAKGVQTEGDADRAMNAMMPDTNDPDVMLQQFDALERASKELIGAHQESLASFEQYYGGQSQQGGNPSGIPDDVSPEEWNAMTPEERALWQ